MKATLIVAALLLSACAHRQLAHVDYGDASPANSAAVRAELEDLGFSVREMPEASREPGGNRIIYGHGVDIDTVSYRLYSVLGSLLQISPTVRGSHFYSQGNLGVYLAREPSAPPREFSGSCGNYFVRAVFWPQGNARLAIEIWDDDHGGYLPHQLESGRWQQDPQLQLLAGEPAQILAQLEAGDAENTYAPSLRLLIEPYASITVCDIPERIVPASLPTSGVHDANADRRR